MNLCIYICTCVYTYMCVYIDLYTYVYTYIYLPTYIYIHIYIYLYIYTHAHTCTHTYKYTYRYTCKNCKYLYVYLYIYTYIYVYINILICQNICHMYLAEGSTLLLHFLLLLLLLWVWHDTFICDKWDILCDKWDIETFIRVISILCVLWLKLLCALDGLLPALSLNLQAYSELHVVTYNHPRRSCGLMKCNCHGTKEIPFPLGLPEEISVRDQNISGYSGSRNDLIPDLLLPWWIFTHRICMPTENDQYIYVNVYMHLYMYINLRHESWVMHQRVSGRCITLRIQPRREERRKERTCVRARSGIYVYIYHIITSWIFCWICWRAPGGNLQITTHTHTHTYTHMHTHTQTHSKHSGFQDTRYAISHLWLSAHTNKSYHQ